MSAVVGGAAGAHFPGVQGPSGSAGGFPIPVFRGTQKSRKGGRDENGWREGGVPRTLPRCPPMVEKGPARGGTSRLEARPPRTLRSLQGSTHRAAGLPPLTPPSVALSRVFPTPLHSFRVREPGRFTFRALNVLALLLLTPRDLLEHFLWVSWDPTQYTLSHSELDALGFE